MSRQIAVLEKIESFSQGSVFTNFLDHAGVRCWGVVISARCDIANRKYDYATVLPVYAIYDWMERHGDLIANENSRRQLARGISDQLSSNGLPSDALDTYGAEEVMRCLNECGIKNGPLKKLKKNIDDYSSLVQEDSNAWRQVGDYNKKRLELINNILSNRVLGFYFLERIFYAEDATGYLVDLRQPETIDMKLLDQVARGLEKSGLRDFSMHESRFYIPKEDMAVFKSQITSPYIEHLMQSFSQAFVRIGLDEPSKKDLDSIRSMYE